MPRKTKSASKTKTKSTKNKIVVKHNVGAKSGNINININTKTTKRKKGETKTNPKLPQPQPSYAPMVQQVQPQQMGDSTALNTIMANLMQKDQEYKNRLDSTILIPDTTPQYKVKPQPIETAITNEIRRPKPTPIALNFDPPKEKPSLLKRIFGSRKSNKIPETPKDEIKLLEYKPELTPSTPIETKKDKSTFSKFIGAPKSLFGSKKLEFEMSPVTISSKPQATAPHAISTQTTEVQTDKQATHAAIDSSIKKRIKEIIKFSSTVELQYGTFSNQLKPILESEGIASNIRPTYYQKYYPLYRQGFAQNKSQVEPEDVGGVSEITLAPQYDDAAGVGLKPKK